MVGFGQPTIADVSFRNPRHPAVGIHTLRLKELYQRRPVAERDRPASDAGAPARPGHGRPGQLHGGLRDRTRAAPVGCSGCGPGQFVGFPPPGIDATLVLFEPRVPVRRRRSRHARHHRTAEPGGTPAPTGSPPARTSEAIVDGVSQLEIDYARMVTGDDIPLAVLRHQLAALLLRLTPARAGGRARPGGGRQRDPGPVPRPRSTSGSPGPGRSRSTPKLLGCSVRTLTRASLAATGRTAKQLVDDRVALEAKRLLAESDLPVAEIGARLGFTEPTNFGRFFARTVGSSPGQFRVDSRPPAAEADQVPPTNTPPAQPLDRRTGQSRRHPPPPLTRVSPAQAGRCRQARTPARPCVRVG